MNSTNLQFIPILEGNVKTSAIDVHGNVLVPPGIHSERIFISKPLVHTSYCYVKPLG